MAFLLLVLFDTFSARATRLEMGWSIGRGTGSGSHCVRGHGNRCNVRQGLEPRESACEPPRAFLYLSQLDSDFFGDRGETGNYVVKVSR